MLGRLLGLIRGLVRAFVHLVGKDRKGGSWKLRGDGGLLLGNGPRGGCCRTFEAALGCLGLQQ